jgi:AcrR family transcriptional regulator
MILAMPKVNRKQVIYQRAAELFKHKGYSATSMRDLAEAVGIEPSSLYSHIASKRELLTKICMDTALRFTSGLQHIVDTVSDPVEQLRQVIDLHVAVARDSPSSVTVFTDEWRHLDLADLQTFEDQRRSYQRAVKAIIVRGLEHGLFTDIDPRTTTKTLLTGLRWIHVWQGEGKAPDYDVIAADIKRLFLDGMIVR